LRESAARQGARFGAAETGQDWPNFPGPSLNFANARQAFQVAESCDINWIRKIPAKRRSFRPARPRSWRFTASSRARATKRHNTPADFQKENCRVRLWTAALG
jgi:hypothetical protein